MTSAIRVVGVLSVALLLLGRPVPTANGGIAEQGAFDHPATATELGTLALGSGQFIENVGQLSDSGITHYLRAGSTLIGFAESSVLIHITDDSAALDRRRGTDLTGDRAEDLHPVRTRGALVRVSFEGSNRVAPLGRAELPHRIAFFLGDDPARWRVGVRAFAELVFPDIYEGTDLVYRITAEGLKYEFVVRPGGDADSILLRYEGVEGLDVSPAGVRIRTAIGDIHDSSIVGFLAGRSIPCSFVPRDSRSHGFACEGRELDEELIIDPLIYSTYLGGAAGFGGGRDTPHSLAVDSSGDIYVAGETESTDFPATPGAFDLTLNGSSDALITKIRPAGNGPADLLYAAYLGGDGWDFVNELQVRANGELYVAGRTRSTDFPTTAGAYDRLANVMMMDGFLAVLVLGGGGQADLLYSTYLGGAASDEVKGMAVDGSGNAQMCGLTNSTDFPATVGAWSATLNGSYDAFLTVMNPAGSGPADLVYSTFLGGGGSDYCYDIALDSGMAYMTGHTYGAYPTTPGAFNGTFAGGWDGIFSVIAPLGSGAADLVYSTMFGGNNADTPYAIVTFAGDAFITGYTHSPDFPVTPTSFDPLYNASSDGFLVQFRPAGGGASDLVYSTYFGGSGIENPAAIAVDAGGNPCVTGQTGSLGFPLTPDAFQGIFGGMEDAFLLEFVPAGGGVGDLLYSTFLGGGGEDEGHAIVFDSSDDVYIASRTFLGNFPTTPGAYSETPIGSVDVAVTKLRLGPNQPPTADAGADHSGTRNVSATVDGSGSSDPDGVPLRHSWSLISGPSVPTIVNSTRATASFVPTQLGTYSFNLTVTDGDGVRAYDAVNVTVNNVPPVADLIVSPSLPRVGEVSTSFANTSQDPDGSIIGFNFTFGDGGASENMIGTATHAWSAPGIYQVNVTVTDSDGAVDAASMPVAVMANQPPVADAGTDAVYPKNTTVQLNGTASSDPEDDPITFAWAQVSGIPLSITNASTSLASAWILSSGVYSFRLWVNDSLGGSGTGTIQVTMTNAAPVADAGPDTSRPRYVLVSLDGVASSDADGDPLSFVWTQTAGPSVTLSDANTPVATFTPTVLGTYTFELTVDDGDGGTGTDTVMVTIFNRGPSITSTSPATPQLTTLKGEGVSFSVVATDLDGDLITYEWTVDGSPQSSTSAFLSLAASEAGTHIVNITVSDGSLTDKYSWTVMVSETPPTTPPPSEFPFLLLGLAMAAILIVAVILLWWRKRRNASRKDQNM